MVWSFATVLLSPFSAYRLSPRLQRTSSTFLCAYVGVKSFKTSHHIELLQVGSFPAINPLFGHLRATTARQANPDDYSDTIFDHSQNEACHSKMSDAIDELPCSSSDETKDVGNNGNGGNSVVVQISGTSRNTGKPNAHAAHGVIYGDDSNLNHCDIVPPHLPQTSQVAYPCAAKQVLRDVLDGSSHCNPEFRPRSILVPTDSSHLIKSICVEIWKWKENGVRNQRGLFIQNRRLFRQLDSVIESLLAAGVAVSFWQIQREENEAAQALANGILDMAERLLWRKLW